MVKHKKALEVLKFQNLKTSLKNPETLLRSPQFVIHQKSPASRHHSFKLDSKLKYLNSDQLPLSKRNKLGYSVGYSTLLGMPSEALLWFAYVYMVCVFIKLITSGNTKIYRKEWRSPKTHGF